ncbi:MAG: hypothetical protein JWO77_2032 [Ilumatobacteraceae bacterium]|nr:hypothetical protein [Ilumatobacteraceae bacterium]
MGPFSSCSCGQLVDSIERADDGTDDRLARWCSTLSDPRSMRCSYQPIFDVRTMAIVGQEALLRVTDVETDVVIPPFELFSAAARGGWHQALDQAARRTAILGAAGWLGDRRLFVNFLPSSIYNPSICLQTTEAAAAEAGVPMDQLVFEVVESEHIASIPRLRAIFDRYHEMGAQVALDDLGADHATFGVAEALRPDIMKIDGDIARRLPEPTAVEFVRQAVALAAASGGKVLIEGVEEQTQLECAIELGVDLAQGYLLGRPAPAPAPEPADRHENLTVRSTPVVVS